MNTSSTAPTVTGSTFGQVNTGYSFTAESSDADDGYIHLNFVFLDYSCDKPWNYYVKVSAEDDKGEGKIL